MKIKSQDKPARNLVSRLSTGMNSLLQNGDPRPFNVVREQGKSPFLLTGDHAGSAVPHALKGLGLPASELGRHIGIDIGIATLGQMLSAAIDATFVSQPYSRLVIDCNRQKGQADSIPVTIDGTHIPGNAALDINDRALRESAIFDPYHVQIARLLDERKIQNRATVLVALHSFTPHHGDFPSQRPWHISILYNRDARLARPLLKRLHDEEDIVVGENEPYVVSDELDYGIPIHGEARGILSVEIEIRQDTLNDDDACQRWSDRLARLLPAALADVKSTSHAV